MDQIGAFIPRELKEIRKSIDAIDLGPVRYKLMDPKDGEGWSKALVDEVEMWYRRFLYLSVKERRQGRSVVPNQFIDKFWHYHILDTAKYAADCDEGLGFFLHHFPYFGMRGEDDASQLAKAFAATTALFLGEYGESPASITARNSIGREDKSDESEVVLAGASHCANACTTPCEGGAARSMERPTA